MKITKIISSQIGTVKGRVQTKKANFPDVSFKKRTDATADDSNITWGGILITAAAAFAVFSLAVLGIKKFAGRILREAGQKIPRPPKNLPDVELKLDIKKLRELPLEVKREAKQALNDAITHKDYQKVLRDYKIGMGV